MNEKLVSIIICTYNRAKYLERCIESLKKQTYLNFEIIVVNGPSTDDTYKVLEKFPEIRSIKQNKLNGLSFARNLGIEISKGDIIAFIDDDAIADKNWLKYLVNGYTDRLIGGVGGLVCSPKGSTLPLIQFDNGTISKIGIPIPIHDSGYILRQDEFQIIMGTNSSFRRDILYEVGGFDPYFRYYHDESDLCVRIALKGYNIVYQRNALVMHDMVEGHNRKSRYDLNWSEIMKNVIYFTLKNFKNDLSSYTLWPTKSLYLWLRNFYNIYHNKEISLKQLFHIYIKLIIGAIKGYTDGLKINLSKVLFSNNYQHNNTLIYNDKEKMINMAVSTNDKIRICLLSQEFSKDCNGGVCRYTYDLAHALAELGNEIHIITRSEKDREYEYRDGKVLVHKIIPEQINFLNLPENMEISRKNLEYSYTACLKLLDLIDKFGIQIVEAPLWDAEGFVFSLIKNIPLVVRIETPLFKVAEIQEWKVTKDLKLANWIEGETVRRADKVIAISKDIGILISNHHNIPREMIELCQLGIELPDEKLINNQNRHRLNVLFVGRLEKRKGIETLFRTIPMILSKFPDIQFNIVGKDTNLSPDGGSYKKYLLKNIDKKFHDSIKFAGYVKNEELKNYYQNCDIFVAPSLYESFGLIFLEAMAWGKSVIGCDIGGISEIIENNKNGILIKPNDSDILADEIIKLLANIDLRNKLGSDGRNKVKDNFSIKKMTDNTLKIYKEINNHMVQKDHVERMKKDGQLNLDYYMKIMKIRYPEYICLIKKYKPTGNILDIGSGFSDILYNEYIRPNGYIYYCTDMSHEVIDHMSDILGKDHTKQGELENLPWPSNSFDIVYASHVLEHSTNINKAFNEIGRVLKFDGILLFAVPCGYDDEPAHTHNRELEEWKLDFKENNWEVLECGQFSFNLNEFYGVAKLRKINTI